MVSAGRPPEVCSSSGVRCDNRWIMKRDQQLVVDFLSAYNRDGGTTFKVVRWPDEEDRNNQAVEAVAANDVGVTIAFEHTLIEPFEGERIDSDRFLKVFGTLEGCCDLMKPGYNVDVYVRVGAIPTGVKWEGVADRVREHISRKVPFFAEGQLSESIAGLTFPLEVMLTVTAHGAGEADHVWVSRILPADSLRSVVRRALRRKLPKLVATMADRRVLLLEKADFAHGYFNARVAIDELGPEFPELKQVDEIWLVITPSWQSEEVLFFYELFPVLGGKRFKIDSHRTALAGQGN